MTYASFMRMDLSQHIGEWVAISGEKIIASGKDFKEVFAKAKLTSKRPFVARVPDGGTLLY